MLACYQIPDPFVMKSFSRFWQGDFDDVNQETQAAFADQIVRKLRDADAMLNAGKDLADALQSLEVSQSTYERWRNQYGGIKSEEAKRLENENKRLKRLVADQALDIQMLKFVNEGNW